MSRSYPRYTVHEGCDHIFFVGFFGAGKSTVVRNLGELFGRRFVDTDRLVERRLGMRVRAVFEEQGEEFFREAETSELRRLERAKSLLVSCGGGIVERRENCELMRSMGTVVFLDGDLEDSLRHIRGFSVRPDFSNAEEAAALFVRRRPLYERAADLTVNIRNRSFAEIAEDSGRLLWERGLL